MKTNQTLETIDRELCGRIVRQRTKDGFIRLWDIEAIGKLYRLQNGLSEINFSDYLRKDNVREFLAELEKETGLKPYIKSRKANSGWVHPFFAIKILTHYNPKFEVQVYKWLFDFLVENRMRGGDSYNVMCGVVFSYTTDKTGFHRNIQKLANIIKDKLGVKDWDNATAEQLENRDILQNYITDATRTLKDSKLGIKLGIEMYNARKDRSFV